MGKFNDTKYINTIDSLVSATKDKLINPYYPFGDRKPTKVTYYSQNIEKSTLDEASGLYGAHVGKDSPFKFNKINNFLLYGIDKITTEYDVGDFGTESTPITGDAIILPNTIIPRPGDFFSISYVKENLLFKVNASTIDTIDTGANLYKIEYELELTNTIESIENQIEKTFSFIAKNVGSDFSSIILNEDINLINKLENLVSELIISFQNIFFDSKLQTFVYNYDGWHFYDPYLIEFLIRNKVLSYAGEYIYVSHATDVNKTFGMNYSKSFFYSLEHPDEEINCSINATADLIEDTNSLFATRIDSYYRIDYCDKTPFKTRLQIIGQDIIDKIKSNTLFLKGEENEFYNLWILYFNNFDNSMDGNILDIIKRMDYMDNKDYFYAIPITIFIIEKYIECVLR